MSDVTVSAGSRLHFGLICGAPDSGWHYGGIGLMIEDPSWRLTLSSLSESADDVLASEVVANRTRGIIESYRSEVVTELPVGIRCAFDAEVPFHNGLGSGTQLTLALAAGLTVLAGQPRPESIAPVAERLGRSRRSAIGTFGFDNGGFFIDRGRSDTGERICERTSFPDEWRLVLVTPNESLGMFGTAEETFFDETSFLDANSLREITTVIEDGIRPALERQCFRQFALCLSDYGGLIGRYYSKGQGGVYSSPVIRELADWLQSKGDSVPVQSSWGPTVAIPAESVAAAERLSREITDESPGAAVRVVITSARNTGATITTTAPESHRTFG